MTEDDKPIDNLDCPFCHHECGNSGTSNYYQCYLKPQGQGHRPCKYPDALKCYIYANRHSIINKSPDKDLLLSLDRAER